MINYKQIRESLSFIDLTEEEKQKRGILARLYGPCASISDATRNGRLYSDELWEKVFNENEIVKEMFECNGIPMELDHPLNREETDSQRIAAMLPEPPKRDEDGHLICYVDLIDTPCGKIAYQLAKYGFKLGISSRGSGDVLPDDSVDPDTYDFTTFDLVLLPAVKDARLTMCESLDVNKAKLQEALIETYNNLSSKEEKQIMKETLDNLNINMPLSEAVEDAKDIDFNNPDLSIDVSENLTESSEAEEVDNSEIESNDSSEKEQDEQEDAAEVETVGDLIKELKEFDKDLNVDFKPIVIDGVEYPVKMLSFDDSKDGKILVEVGYDSEMNDNIDDEISNDAELVDADESVDDEVSKESNEVIDNKSDDVLENLKEAIRKKDALEIQVKTLEENKAVSDAEVKKLSEELNKYKVAFARTSEIAAKGKKSEAEVSALTEKLNQKTNEAAIKDEEIKSLKAAQEQANALNETFEKSKENVKKLAEKLKTSIKDAETQKEQLSEQVNIYKKKLVEKNEIINKYKAENANILNEYINFRASMLGVKPSEITKKLDENYSIKNINLICESILNDGMPDVPCKYGTATRSKITESKNNMFEDDDLKDLYELAGLV